MVVVRLAMSSLEIAKDWLGKRVSPHREWLPN